MLVFDGVDRCGRRCVQSDAVLVLAGRLRRGRRGGRSGSGSDSRSEISSSVRRADDGRRLGARPLIPHGDNAAIRRLEKGFGNGRRRSPLPLHHLDHLILLLLLRGSNASRPALDAQGHPLIGLRRCIDSLAILPSNLLEANVRVAVVVAASAVLQATAGPPGRHAGEVRQLRVVGEVEAAGAGDVVVHQAAAPHEQVRQGAVERGRAPRGHDAAAGVAAVGDGLLEQVHLVLAAGVELRDDVARGVLSEEGLGARYQKVLVHVHGGEEEERAASVAGGGGGQGRTVYHACRLISVSGRRDMLPDLDFPFHRHGTYYSVGKHRGNGIPISYARR